MAQVIVCDHPDLGRRTDVIDQTDVGIVSPLGTCQSNSKPRAPTQRAFQQDTVSSGVVQPRAAAVILYSPMPAFKDMTRLRSIGSVISTLAS